MNPNKALWEKGDFTRIAESMRESGEGLVSTLGITEGLEVLDLQDEISFERDTYTFNYPASPSDFLAEFKAYYGPTMNAYEAAAASGRQPELNAELDALFSSQNTSSSEALTSIPATFLRVTVAS